MINCGYPKSLCISGDTKSVVITLFVSATCFLASIAATELLFALGLTTIFVVYALDPARDPRMHRRIATSLLLMASYDTVAFSNLTLAIGTCISARDEPATMKKNYVLAGLLSLALPFQMACRFFESATPGQGVHQWFVLAICGVFIAILLVGAMYFKFVGNSYILWTGAVFVCHSHFSVTYSGFDRSSDARVSFRVSVADL